MPRIKACTVLRCRRCQRMCNRGEVLIVRMNEKGETWRCSDCGGVCDAVQLGHVKEENEKSPPSKRMEQQK